MRVAGSERRVGVDLDGVRDLPMRGWRSSDRMCRLSATVFAGGSLYRDIGRCDGSCHSLADFSIVPCELRARSGASEPMRGSTLGRWVVSLERRTLDRFRQNVAN